MTYLYHWPNTMTITPAELELIRQHPLVEKCILLKPESQDGLWLTHTIAVTNNPAIYVLLKSGFVFSKGVGDDLNWREGHFKTYNEFLLAEPKQAIAKPPVEPPMSLPVTVDPQDTAALSDAQCQAFRSMPGSFETMVRAIYRAGHAKGSSEAIATLRPFVQDVSEQLGEEECNNCDLANNAIGNLEAQMDQICAVALGTSASAFPV
jgi:hypothetical protein